MSRSSFGLAAISILQIVANRLDREISAARLALAIVRATLRDDIGIVSVISTFVFLSAALALGQEVHKTRTTRRG